MFGIDTISWRHFLSFILVILLIWYGTVILFCFFKGKQQNSRLYEDANDGENNSLSNLQPVKVSSGAFPSELIPYPNENIPLEVVYYEETGLEEGYIIDEFTQNNNPAILQKIQYQQL